MRSLDLQVAADSHTGMVREANEDSFMLIPEPDPGLRASRGRLLLVADGMGGAAGGGNASSIVASVVRDAYYANTEGSIRDALHRAIEQANDTIRQHVKARPELEGMGSTCTAAVVHDGGLWLAHVGDTRLYLMRDGAIHPLTNDHSVVGQMVRDGLISQAEAANHPKSNVILRCIGPKPEVEVEIPERSMPLEDGDTLLLCSDGLSGKVTDAEMLEVLRAEPPRSAVETLIELAKRRGGEDNITVLVARVGESRTAPTTRPELRDVVDVIEVGMPPTDSPRSRSSLSPLVGLALALAVAGAVLAWWLLAAQDALPTPDAGVELSATDGALANTGRADAAVEATLDGTSGTPSSNRAATDADSSSSQAVQGATGDSQSRPPDPSAKPGPNRYLTEIKLGKALVNLGQYKAQCPDFVERLYAELNGGRSLPTQEALRNETLVRLINMVADWQEVNSNDPKSDVDGDAGPKTQQKLFGRVICPRPAGSK